MLTLTRSAPSLGWNQSKLFNSLSCPLGICFEFDIKFMIVYRRIWFRLFTVTDVNIFR